MQYNIGSAVSHCIVVAAVQVEIINIIVVALLHATHTTYSMLNSSLGGSFLCTPVLSTALKPTHNQSFN